MKKYIKNLIIGAICIIILLFGYVIVRYNNAEKIAISCTAVDFNNSNKYYVRKAKFLSFSKTYCTKEFNGTSITVNICGECNVGYGGKKPFSAKVKVPIFGKAKVIKSKIDLR